MSAERMREVSTLAVVRAVRDVAVVGEGHWGDSALVADEIRRLIREGLMPEGLIVEVRSAIYQLLMHSWHSGDITITRPMTDLYAELSKEDYWELMKAHFVAGRTDEDQVSVHARVAALALGEPVDPLHDDRDEEER